MPRNGQGTLLFVDEIHRFNRAQQDSFLPVMEDGTIVLVGATTENPSFELNGRCFRAPGSWSSNHSTGSNRKAARARREHQERQLPLDTEARALPMADGDGARR